MKLIKLKEDHYIIVDDSEIKEGDFCYDPEGDPGHNNIKCIVKCLRTNPDSYWNKYSKKITHSTKPLNTDFSDWFDAQIITLQEVKELLGGVDVDKKAEEMANKLQWDFESLCGNGYDDYVDGIKIGYNQALEDNKEKKYTEEDMIEAYKMGLMSLSEKRLKDYMQPKTEWEYVGECKGNNGNGCFMDSSGHDCGCYKRVPKTSWEVEFIDGKLKLKL